jgi:anti-anti-sigma factor
MRSDDDGLIQVRLLDLPTHIQREASAHHDALVREFTLIQGSSAPEALPQRLLTLIDELQNRFQEFSHAPRAAIEAAVEKGAPSVDVTYVVPKDVGDAVVHLRELLDEADDYCRAGEHLVTLATPPLARAYREWFLGEFIRQAAGGSPQPWTRPHEDQTADQTWSTKVKGSDATVTLVGELDLASAPDLRDHFTKLHAVGVRSFSLHSAGVSFIDSVGLSVILSLYRRCREEQGAIAIVSPSPVMRRTLEVAGLLDLLNVVD